MQKLKFLNTLKFCENSKVLQKKQRGNEWIGVLTNTAAECAVYLQLLPLRDHHILEAEEHVPGFVPQ